MDFLKKVQLVILTVALILTTVSVSAEVTKLVSIKVQLDPNGPGEMGG